jgi:MarR family 2-MHQ and catechol resistance regulon transcriptional repressor
MQFMVLEALLHKNSMTVGEIKDAILSSNGTIPVIINNLVKLGLVRRTKDPEDHRRSVIELTEQGRELIGQVCPENDRMFTERFGVWSQEEKKELLLLFDKYRKKFPNSEGR